MVLRYTLLFKKIYESIFAFTKKLAVKLNKRFFLENRISKIVWISEKTSICFK